MLAVLLAVLLGVLLLLYLLLAVLLDMIQVLWRGGLDQVLVVGVGVGDCSCAAARPPVVRTEWIDEVGEGSRDGFAISVAELTLGLLFFFAAAGADGFDLFSLACLS